MADKPLDALTDAELLDQVNEWFDEAQISQYDTAPVFALSQVKLIIAQDFNLIQQVNKDFKNYLRETMAQGVATRMSPDELRRQIIEDVEGGRAKLKALKVIDKNGNTRIDSMQTRAQRIARTELFKTYETSKRNTAGEFMEEAIGIWRTLGDRVVRPDHQELDGRAKRLDDWAIHPGDEINCRCTMIIEEARRFDGEVETGLLLGRY